MASPFDHSLVESALWQDAVRRYSQGEWRAPIWRDLLLAEAASRGPSPTVLDIGCGHGFDGSEKLQADIASVAGEFIGVEPDREITVPAHFDHVYRSDFENARINPGTIDVAYSVMVLEHVENPDRFWRHVRKCLRSGGVFWGFTADSRHYFCKVSTWMDRLKIKDTYLTLLGGQRGQDRYENYPVYYRSNSPNALRSLARDFANCDVGSLSRPGELSTYYPRFLSPFFSFLDRRVVRNNDYGYLLVTRVVK